MSVTRVAGCVLVAMVCGMGSARAVAGAREIHVSPEGQASAAGTQQAPLDLADAVKQAQSGDTILVAWGNYRLNQTITLATKASAEQPIRIEQNGPTRPILDFADQTEGHGNHGIDLTGDGWQLRGIEIAHAGAQGLYITGGHNQISDCVFRENRDSGLQMDKGASDNLVFNCDSYRNFDPATKGENADGFAAKHGIGPGNVFRGCRSYQNADDGWDLWMAPQPVVIEDCFAWRNGLNIFGIDDFQGDGNGFKLGGNYVGGAHVVQRCVAVEQPGNGFDQNHNVAGLKIVNCIAIRCGHGFSLPEVPRTGQNVLRFDTSFGCPNVLERQMISDDNQWIPDIAQGNPGPPPRPGHRDVPGAGEVPTTQPQPLITPGPAGAAPK